MSESEVALRKKILKPFERVCRECRQSVDDCSITNGLSYLLCTKKIEYVVADKFACDEFQLSEQAKEKQKKYEVQEKEKKIQEFILNKSW